MRPWFPPAKSVVFGDGPLPADSSGIAGCVVNAFVYNANPGRVIFGAGTLSRLPAEVERLGLTRVLVLATTVQESSAQELSRQIGVRSAGVFADARMHTPVEVTERAMAVVTELECDGFVAVGGGSTTG